ncbi:TPA: hypothetical protein U2D29_002279 [Streptococcus suis]|uniref:hypothetical protein n=1 Tax=Streptococcus suis TaxID=1307 RepID=UPI0015523583|nr:hypothetical protein [Streptococcus suis]HEL2027876.1 hypothetical protein [Streptococcus suis]HEM4388972.1 hypothetical protein [Streptococcus suis]HEM4610072.1 hypothetical protein [Streptococcus suis]HEM5056896.1 hypothetical protein [Streptococcus suis]
MKFWDMMKRFLSLDEVEDSANIVNPLTSSEEKWKALALELNKELQRTREQHKFAIQECVRLQAICDCQAELLADREV